MICLVIVLVSSVFVGVCEEVEKCKENEMNVLNMSVSGEIEIFENISRNYRNICFLVQYYWQYRCREGLLWFSNSVCKNERCGCREGTYIDINKCQPKPGMVVYFFICVDAFDVCIVGGQCLSGRCLNDLCARIISLENYVAIAVVILLLVIGVTLAVVIRCRWIRFQPRIHTPDISSRIPT